jgi:dihydrofolate reductase
MRKIIVLSFVSLDGVMQAPGTPTEDPSGNFTLGGWTVPYFDNFLGEVMTEQMSKPFDLLLGRKTFEIFAAYWPHHEEEGAGINKATKYVVSNTLTKHDWKTSVFVGGDVVAELKKLKETEGPDLHDLVDELWLKIFPVTLGSGKQLFGKGVMPAAFTLTKCVPSPVGVIIANYTRSGEVVTGSF